MRKLILTFVLLLFASTAFGAARGAQSAYLCSALTGGGAGSLDSLDITGASTPNQYDLADGDVAEGRLISGTTTTVYTYIFDADGTDAEDDPDIIRPDDYSTAGVWRLHGVYLTANDIGSTGDWSEKLIQLDVDGKLPSTLYNAVVQGNIAVPQRMEITSDDSLTTSEIYNYHVFTNQGATQEVDITLPAVSYDLCRAIKLEEDYVIEVGPPSGEQFYLEGDGWLTADYVIDSPATYPAMLMFCRGKNEAGNWRYFMFPTLGTWVDSGLTD